MELRHLRYFLAVAEERHFTRAARRLNMSQQPLSVAIRQLEASLGVALFVRTTRSVALTAAGDAFAIEARLVLEQLERAVRAAREPVVGARLRLAYPTTYGDLPHSAVTAYRRIDPTAVVELIKCPPREQEAAILGGEADIGIVVPPLTSRQLRYRELFSEELWLALPSSHPLARRRRLSLASLAEEPLILPSSRVWASFAALQRHIFGQAGFVPSAAEESPSTGATLDAVARRTGVALVGERHRHRSIRGVALRPLEEAPRVRFGTIVRKGDRGAERTRIDAFLDVLDGEMSRLMRADGVSTGA